MAGKMGNDNTTLKNLVVLEVTEDSMLIAGLVPGIKGAYVTVAKVGKKMKNMSALLKEEVAVVETAPVVEEVKVEEAKFASELVTEEQKEEIKE